MRPIEFSGPAKQSYPLHTSIAIRSALSGLAAGDYVVLTGQFIDSDLDGNNDVLAVSGIESVGIKKLLGNWRTTNWDIFHFQNYTRLELYRPSPAASRSTTLRLQKLKVLNYTLAPEANGSFSVLMVEATDTSLREMRTTNPVFAGRIELTSKNGIRLDVFDPTSGKTIESHELTQIESTK